MRKHKWFIPVVLSVVLIGGITGGVIAAADDNSGTVDQQSQLADLHQELLDRACAIYQENMGTAIDSEQFKAALKQAQGELQEEALESRLQDLVENGDRVMRCYFALPHVYRDIVDPHIARTARGMARFQERKLESNSRVFQLRSIEDLEEYCYYVAGIVGEMLC